MFDTAKSVIGSFARYLVLSVGLIVATLMVAPVAAQSTTGTILGTVTDAEGLALPGASVTATNTDTARRGPS